MAPSCLEKPEKIMDARSRETLGALSVMVRNCREKPPRRGKVMEARSRETLGGLSLTARNCQHAGSLEILHISRMVQMHARKTRTKGPGALSVMVPNCLEKP